MTANSRTDAYRFTITDRADPRLAALKLEVREANQKRKADGSDRRLRVALRGRLGRNSPNSGIIRSRGYAGPQYVPVHLASRWDVYVHEGYAEPAWKTEERVPTPPPVNRAQIEAEEMVQNFRQMAVSTLMVRHNLAESLAKLEVELAIMEVFDLEPAEPPFAD
jgi:hypothetical protein